MWREILKSALCFSLKSWILSSRIETSFHIQGVPPISYQFNYNFLILYQCYCKSKTCSEKLRPKSSRDHLNFIFSKKMNISITSAKTKTKREIFLAPCPHPLTNGNELQYLLYIQFSRKKLRVAPWKLLSMLFRTGFTFAVTLIPHCLRTIH